MTKEEALKTLSDFDRVGVHIIHGNDEETEKYNKDSWNAFYMAVGALAKWKTGYWVYAPRFTEFDGKPMKDAQPNLKCPFCGYEIGWWDMNNFCAKCGAELLEKEND